MFLRYGALPVSLFSWAEVVFFFVYGPSGSFGLFERYLHFVEKSTLEFLSR